MTRRIQAFDILRGILVTGMVAVHVLTHAARLAVPDVAVLWIAVGFVFMSGMLGGAVLARSRHPMRMALRGAKLVVLFLVLNLLLRGTEPLADLLLRGDVRASVFEILLPIGVVVALLPVFRLAPRLAGGLGLAAILLFDLLQFWPFVTKFVAVGALGFALGSRPEPTRVWERDATALLGLPLAAGALASFFLGVQQAPLLTSLLVWLTLAPVFLALARLAPPFGGWAALLGRHSLLLYVAHVALLTVLAPTGMPAVLTFPLLLAVCTLLAWAAENAARIPLAERAYKAVFR